MRQPQSPLLILIWPFCLGFLIITAIGVIGLEIMVGVRGFGTGENVWAKNQKNATFQLLRYLHTNSQEAKALYQKAAMLHLRFAEGREIITHTPHETARLREILLPTGMVETDLDKAIWLQRYFSRLPTFRELLAFWESAEKHMLQLDDICQAITIYHQHSWHDPDELEQLTARIYQLDSIIQPLEEQFAAKLSEISYELYRFLLTVEIVLLLTLLSGIVWRTRHILRERQAIADALASERQRAATTLASIGDAVISINEQGKISYLNKAAQTLCAHHPEKDAGNATLEVSELVRLIDESTGKLIPSPLQQLLASGENQTQNESSHCLLRRDGSSVSVFWVASLIREQEKILGAVLVMHDTTREKQMIEHLGWLAQRDPLTSLYNRRAFEEHLSKALDGLRKCDVERRDCAVGHVLIFIDLDQFKVVNDISGHAAGDELLCLISNQIASQLRSQDVLARMGGDEFAILLVNCSQEAGEQRAESIRQRIGEVELIKGARKFTSTASIGLVHLHTPGEKPSSALSAADLACYKAKDNGRNRVEVYHPEDAELAARYGEMNWVPRIHRALQEQRFQLYAQPIVSLFPQAKLPPHFELLLRLRDEDDHIIAPGAFIPAAERYGLMPLLDRWVVNQAFAHISQINALDPENRQHVFAINLSGATFCERDFSEEIKALFKAHDVEYRQICFEITETHAVTNLSQALEFITQMRALGCAFALDDFGSGMSSFGYLKHLPIDYLKIDGALVKGMSGNAVDKAMVEMINHLGHAMQTRTIGEYAETPAIVEALRQSGVDFAQGYALAHPAPWPQQKAEAGQ